MFKYVLWALRDIRSILKQQFAFSIIFFAESNKIRHSKSDNSRLHKLTLDETYDILFEPSFTVAPQIIRLTVKCEIKSFENSYRQN